MQWLEGKLMAFPKLWNSHENKTRISYTMKESLPSCQTDLTCLLLMSCLPPRPAGLELAILDNIFIPTRWSSSTSLVLMIIGDLLNVLSLFNMLTQKFWCAVMQRLCIVKGVGHFFLCSCAPSAWSWRSEYDMLWIFKQHCTWDHWCLTEQSVQIHSFQYIFLLLLRFHGPWWFRALACLFEQSLFSLHSVDAGLTIGENDGSRS